MKKTKMTKGKPGFMKTGGMNNPNADVAVSPKMKGGGGMYRKGGKTGMKKGK